MPSCVLLLALLSVSVGVEGQFRGGMFSDAATSPLSCFLCLPLTVDVAAGDAVGALTCIASRRGIVRVCVRAARVGKKGRRC